MSQLYPLKFKPQLKEKLWGGNKLETLLNKEGCSGKKIGESWEISSIQENISIVSNGFLKGNSLQELIEVYMGDIVGDRVYDKYGIEFPLLIKFIDAAEDLSIQVHPDDKYAMEKHGAYGKTEMWYVLDAEKGAIIYSGFKEDVTKDQFLSSIDDGTITDSLNKLETAPDKVYYLPPGRIHSIGKGNLLAEIQQTSDVTYRVFDWKRKDKEGEERELHIDFAKDVVNYSKCKETDVEFEKLKNTRVDIITNKHFTTGYFDIEHKITLDYELFDSFKVFMCIDGEMDINYDGENSVNLKKGESVLIPSELTMIDLTPKSSVKFLEIYII